MGGSAGVTEAYMASAPPQIESSPEADALDSPAAISHAAAQAAIKLKARLVAVWTATGTTARMVARHRLSIPVVALTWDASVARRLNLFYGIVPLHMEPTPEPERMFYALDARLRSVGLVEDGDLVVIVTSTRPNEPGGTNALLVHTIGDTRASAGA